MVKLALAKYIHPPTIFYFKLDINKQIRYIHLDVCMFGVGVETWLSTDLKFWYTYRKYKS